MKWLGKLFGTEKAVDNILDNEKGLLVRAGGWIDGLKHTDQEKAEHQLLVKQWGLKQLEALHPFKVVQRIIVFAIMSMWAIVGLNLAVAIWLKAVMGIDAVTDFKELAFSDYIFWPTVSVLSLYVTGGVLPTKK